MPGESTISYIRRLAHANHLPASHLRRYLSQPDATEPIRVQWLAALSGRTVTTLERAPPDLTTENHARSSARVHLHRGEKPAMFTTIRQDAHDQGGSIRALADRHGVHRRIIRQALLSPHPAPRKKIVRGSRFDPFKDVIAEMLQPQLNRPPAARPSNRSTTGSSQSTAWPASATPLSTTTSPGNSRFEPDNRHGTVPSQEKPQFTARPTSHDPRERTALAVVPRCPR
jgi:hypothetical protein